MSQSEPWICPECGGEMEYDEVVGCWICINCVANYGDSGDYVPPHERDDYFWEDVDEEEYWAEPE